MSPDTSPQKDLPYTKTILTLGILSIFIFLFIGIALGILALLLAKKSQAVYFKHPDAYTVSSFNRIGIGKICASVGLILGGFYVFYRLVHLAFFGSLFV